MILHIDMNAYFATMEQQANPFLRGRPILVCGKGSGERTVVATASYEAKNRGVKTGMAVWEAKKLVPEAVIVAADYDRYLDTTRRLGVIFEHYTPDVEFFSIDEAFLAINSEFEYRNSKQYLNSKLQIPNVWNLGFKRFEFVSDFVLRASDLETQTAITVAINIKRDIRETLGDHVTCSIGIAENKLLAKIASEFKKPDGLVIIVTPGEAAQQGRLSKRHRKGSSDLSGRPLLPSQAAWTTGPAAGGQELPSSLASGPPLADRAVSRVGSEPGCAVFITQTELYNQIKLDDIPGIGPRILRRLLQLGITSPNILGQTPLPILVKEFGNHQGQVLYNLGRGIDHSPVTRNELMPEEKSFSHSYTLPKEIYTYADARKVLLELCEMVGRRMRKKGFAGRTISVFMRFTDMTACFERKTLKEYTNNGLQIFRAGESLLQKTWAFKNKRVAKPLAQTRITEDSAGLGGRRGDRGRNRVPGRDLPLEQINSRRAKQWGEPGPAYFSYKPIRQVGIWVTNLTHERNLPLPLFPQDRRQLNALKTMDQINDKHGEHTIMRAPILEIYQKVQKIPDGRNKRQFH